MSKVRSLTIEGYKSIRKLENFPLTNLNVLIGANGAGKSNFIGLFKLLNAMYEQQLQLFVQKHGGANSLLHFGNKTTEKIHAEFYFDRDGYKFDLIPTEDNRLIFGDEINVVWQAALSLRKLTKLRQKTQPSYSPDNDTNLNAESREFSFGKSHDEAKLKNALDEDSPYIRASIESWRIYHFHDTSDTAKVKQLHAANINLRLLPDAGNLAAYLYMLRNQYPNEYRNIIGVIRLVAPFFDDFVHRSNNPEYVELEWIQVGKPDAPFKAHVLSDGTLRFMCLATLLLQPIALLPDTILIDEPELGLHPYAITILADIFKQVAEYRQLIVSTQSVELINELSPDNIVVVDQIDGASTFKRYTQKELSGWLEQYSLGDLWNSNILGGRP